jgi:hypothetical protein
MGARVVDIVEGSRDVDGHQLEIAMFLARGLEETTIAESAGEESLLSFGSRRESQHRSAPLSCGVWSW